VHDCAPLLQRWSLAWSLLQGRQSAHGGPRFRRRQAGRAESCSRRWYDQIDALQLLPTSLGLLLKGSWACSDVGTFRGLNVRGARSMGLQQSQHAGRRHTVALAPPEAWAKRQVPAQARSLVH
jgi:hypothetical protein